MAGIPLLGILPNLPDRLTDPAQASASPPTASTRSARCCSSTRCGNTAPCSASPARQARATARLQPLARSGPVSFAASRQPHAADRRRPGRRRPDQPARAPTAAVGIVDALAGVGLEECVQPTDVADLSLLPDRQRPGAPRRQLQPAGGPQAVLRNPQALRSDHRRHRPGHGLHRSHPDLRVSVDGVVLTVARGQSRPLVERAITHLTEHRGQSVSGVVFNRAQHKDFEQSHRCDQHPLGRPQHQHGQRHRPQRPGQGRNGRRRLVPSHGSVNRDSLVKSRPTTG